MKRLFLHWMGLALFLGIALFLTFNRHSKSKSFNYHSEIWGDKSGYYVYLPAALKYSFKPGNFPDSIDIKTGNGFVLDYKNNKVRTKYTYGVALMQLPFFLTADILAKPLNQKRDGFSPVYHWSINIAAIFYLFFGLIFLNIYLKSLFRSNISLLVLMSIFLGTNLYYYSIDETGMSHIYSFFLFSSFLYLQRKTQYLSKTNFIKNLFMGFIIGLIIVIRPTNILFLLSFLFLDIDNKNEVLKRIKRLLNYRTSLGIFITGFIIILPQLLYWNYANGSFISYSYGNEGFNWSNPQILSTWFSPNNGLFTYTPFYFLLLASMVFMIINSIKNGMFFLFMFFLISYVFSAWWDWTFGCSFGARSYVEYLVLFSIPLAYLFQYISEQSTAKKIIFGLIVFALITFNLKMTYSYDGCFYGKRNWDWPVYFEIVTRQTK